MSLEDWPTVRLAVVLVVAAACEPPGYGRHPATDAAEGSDAAPVIDAASDASFARTCDHAFRLDGHGTANSAVITGDFTMWGADTAHGAVAMTLGVDGGWTGMHSFQAGTYQYKFVVDGNQWIADPTNTSTVPDGVGGVNSVYVCAPP